MTDSSKEPSKGAVMAAIAIKREYRPLTDGEKVLAQLIDRETKAGEVAKLLRESLDVIIEELAAAGPDEVRSHPTLKRHSQTAAKIERLLTDLYPNEEKGV